MLVSRGGESFLFVNLFYCYSLGIYYWGCAKVYGRGTLYMKWGQGNLRFATMRLRGEKDEKRKKRKYDKNENNKI